ncbi:MAG: acyl-CoA dehydrogenase family protein [Immundisolibacter sp.]|uniref:acyl-CoA dehydrogenase family protein n=1 Tax=Immundisolibacter sp. TaxID=1934948 RepID=UPI0019B08457|nr:acyl-CoA dehydrogenase family protein [Immundisolibacter sp.]MBC7161537.1 acyl-CoA dehydrogenase family protein [Immundisolibacter sp.]
MDLDFSPEDEAFRAQVREFLATQYPADIRRKVELGLALGKDDYVRFQRLLYLKGWIAPSWPVEHGGCGWSATRRYIFEDELAAADTPRIMPFGLKMLAPVLMAFGSPAQQQRFLPRILSSEDWWCQGYSEPGAGSDLASLRTRAEPVDGGYRVNGTKMWTTYAHYANWMFALVRTASTGKKQEGISFLLIDMHSKGVSVRPIITIDGLHVVNQVFLEDVFVPADCLVGGEGQGWTIAKFLLGHERSNIAGVARSKQQLRRLKRIAAERRLLVDPRFADQLARIEIDLLALEYTDLRALWEEAAGHAPGPQASLLKVRGTQIQQAITELLMQAVGPYALPYDVAVLKHGWGGDEPPIGSDYAAPLAASYFDARKTSIYGGSNEIQKNIIAKAVFGL